MICDPDITRWTHTRDNPIRAQVLDAARLLTIGARNRDYGDPIDNLSDAAAIFAAATGIPADPELAAMFMIAAKLSRLRANPVHADSLVDLAAYVAILAEVTALSRRGAATERAG